MLKKITVVALALLMSGVLCYAEEISLVSDSGDETIKESFRTVPELPCPVGWSVEPNPSLDNSLSYLSEDGKLAVSVSVIKPRNDATLSSDSYSRVASEQMGCTIPVHSNLIEDAWSFICQDQEIEALVYGGGNELVLLGISGRTPDTEKQLSEFVRFLAFQAEK